MGSVRLYGATSGYLELQAPDVSPDAALVLPSDSLKSGLVHLHTETFSAKSSVSVDDVFTAEYDNYRVLIELEASTTAVLNMRLRSSGVDNSASIYNRYSIYSAYNSTVAAEAPISQAAWIGWNCGATNCVFNYDLFAPAKNAYSIMRGFHKGVSAYAQTTNTTSVTTAFDGFSLLIGSGTITGTIRVNGYRNS
jgi:hypothetical protein